VFAFDLFIVFIMFFVFILVPHHKYRESVKIGPHPRGHPSSSYKFIWRRKEVQPPRAVSSRAGQEGGCGEEGKQDLKTANMRGSIVNILPPFRADPHALGTKLFEGGRMIWARMRR
jgi:hypothetical protein